MSGAQKRAPEVRFKGFTDDWEQREVIEIAPLQRGFDLPVSEREAGLYPVIMSNGIGDFHSKYKAKAPGVVTGRSGTIGNLTFVETDYWPHNTALWVTDFKNNDAKYIYYLYLKLDLKRFGTGSGVPTLNRNDVHNTITNIPSVSEQKQISRLFSNLDNLIALHQRKLDLLKQLKQAYLQVLFPIEGEKSPRVRFTNFVADWEQRKLGEVADFFDEKRIPIDSGKRNVGEYPYYGATGIIDYVDGYIFDGEYVLLAEDGANIIMRNSPIAYLTEGKFWLNNHAHIMRLKDGSNNFLIQLLEKQNYNKYNSGTAQPKLNGQVLKKIILSFPNKDEQKKIGSFFNTLDDFIALHQKKITAITKLKSLYLQKMFC